jgi:hypothetical protein
VALRGSAIPFRRPLDPVAWDATRRSQPADPGVVVLDGDGWDVGDRLAARDGSRWRSVSIDPDLTSSPRPRTSPLS